MTTLRVAAGLRPPDPCRRTGRGGHAIDADVAAHEREMERLGAEVKGQGQID